MDSFLRQNYTLSLPLLIHSFSKLSTFQIHQGFIALDNIFDSLNEAVKFSNTNKGLSQLEINFYTSIIIEACSLVLSSPGNFSMPQEFVANDQLFLKNLLSVLYMKTKGETYSALEEFKVEVINYMQINLNPSSLRSQNFTNTRINPKEYQESRMNDYKKPFPSFNRPSPGFSPMTMPSPEIRDFQSQKNMYPRNMSSMGRSMYYNSNNPTGLNFNDPMIRFLSILRKAGMDYVFPIASHDKLLASVYASVNAQSFSALRDLIDMTMIIKESNVLTQVEHVSKTKIRGLLALLKQSGCLVTQIQDTGKAVRLIWAPDISNFGELRDRHDLFIHKYLTENRISMSMEIKGDLIWMFDQEARKKRQDMIEVIVNKVFHFITNLDPSLIPSSAKSYIKTSNDDLEIDDEFDNVFTGDEGNNILASNNPFALKQDTTETLNHYQQSSLNHLTTSFGHQNHRMNPNINTQNENNNYQSAQNPQFNKTFKMLNNPDYNQKNNSNFESSPAFVPKFNKTPSGIKPNLTNNFLNSSLRESQYGNSLGSGYTNPKQEYVYQSSNFSNLKTNDYVSKDPLASSEYYNGSYNVIPPNAKAPGTLNFKANNSAQGFLNSPEETKGFFDYSPLNDFNEKFHLPKGGDKLPISQLSLDDKARLDSQLENLIDGIPYKPSNSSQDYDFVSTEESTF